MKQRLKIYSSVIFLILIFTGCDMPLDSESDSDWCYSYGQYGQVIKYRCNQGGGGSYVDRPFKIAVSLPDTAYNKPYAIFFIPDTTTMIPDGAKRGTCGYDTYFFVTCEGVSIVNHYIAVYVSQNQTAPIKFLPQSGDFLGWYKGNGIYPAEKYVYGDPAIISISLKEIP